MDLLGQCTGYRIELVASVGIWKLMQRKLALAVVALVACMEQWLVVGLVCRLVVVGRQRIRRGQGCYRRRRTESFAYA